MQAMQRFLTAQTKLENSLVFWGEVLAPPIDLKKIFTFWLRDEER